MRLVLVAQPLENADCLFGRGLTYQHRLKTAFQCRILFNMLAVFADGGSADDLHLATRQGGLQNVCRIYRTLSRARTDNGMNLIDKENDVGVFRDLFHNALHAFLKLTAVLGARDHAGDIQCNDLLVTERFGHIAVHNSLSKSFDYGCFTNAGFTDEARVVFGAAGQDLHHALGFVITTDDGVDLAFLGECRQIPPVIGKRGGI